MIGAAVFPLQRGGAAEDAASLLGGRESLTIEDRTSYPRWGIKGPGSADWLAAHGLMLPPINRHTLIHGMTLLRLGRNDITVLADPATAGSVADLRRDWEGSSGPKGYPSWREESWAWLALSGDAVETTLERLCAIDLRPGRFAADELAQSRFAQVDAVLFRSGASVQVFFDITATAAVLRAIRQAAGSLDLRTRGKQHR